MTSSRPIIACLGNCQSTVINTFLQSLPELSRAYEFRLITTGRDDETAAPKGGSSASLAYLSANRERLRLVINQESHEWSRLPIQREDVPPGCAYVSYPAAVLNYIWPLIPSWRRPKGARAREYTLFPYTVCDDRVIRLREAGVPRGSLLEEYHKVSPLDLFRVDRLREINLAKLRGMDAKSDFGIAGLIERELASTQLFSTANHPSGPMMAYLLEGIVERAGAIITDGAMAAHKIEQRRAGKGIQDVEAPVHPEIAAHFGLEWARDKRFRFWDEGVFTFDEWLLRLYDYSYCAPYQDALDRIRAKDYEGAEPLLRQAVDELPEAVAMRQTLAGVLSRRGLVDEIVDQWATIYRQAPTGKNLDAYYGALARRSRAKARAFIDALDEVPEDAIAVRLALFADPDPEVRRKAGPEETLTRTFASHPRYWMILAERARHAGDKEAEADHVARAHYASNWSAKFAAQIQKRFGAPPEPGRLGLKPVAAPVARRGKGADPAPEK